MAERRDMSPDEKGENSEPLDTDFLIGTHPRTVPSDGRVTLPREWRAIFGTDCYAWLGEPDVVRIYPPKFWLRLAREESARHSRYKSNADAQDFFSGTTRLSVDTQGRLVLLKDIRERQGLGSQIVLRGHGTHFDVLPAQGGEAADQGRGQQE